MIIRKETESSSKKQKLTNSSIGTLSTSNLVKLKTSSDVAPVNTNTSNKNQQSKPVIKKKLDNLVIIKKKSEPAVEKKQESIPNALSLLGTYSGSDTDSS
ncbi:hypothetical protein CEXT_271071 [Caerostris extrusa]|uniref:Uncharacterized protein n=1 Tax=Caerostris extrusa TaxID=172846 RepID=A0AAV4V1X7_CAEEX|nr:hypothetical protein CEXT_271071 [Caerostris extrusa]